MWGVVVFVSLLVALSTFLFLFYSKRTKKTIDGQTVLITGGARGIGKRMANIFLKKNCRVIVWDIHQQAMNEIKAEFSTYPNFFIYQCDISESKNVYEVAARVKKEVGKVDILINNAGVFWSKSILELPDELLEKTFAINVKSHYWTVKAFLPEMLKDNKGHIVTMASVCSFCSSTQASDYCASKAAAYSFATSLRLELQREGPTEIDTLIVCPYAVNTGLFHGLRLPGPVGILDEETVAVNIVEAIENREHVRFVYKMFGYVFPTLHLIPARVHDWLYKLLNVSSSFDDVKRPNNLET